VLRATFADGSRSIQLEAVGKGVFEVPANPAPTTPTDLAPPKVKFGDERQRFPSPMTVHYDDIVVDVK
jgi:hypothetical protein